MDEQERRRRIAKACGGLVAAVVEANAVGHLYKTGEPQPYLGFYDTRRERLCRFELTFPREEVEACPPIETGRVLFVALAEEAPRVPVAPKTTRPGALKNHPGTDLLVYPPWRF